MPYSDSLSASCSLNHPRNFMEHLTATIKKSTERERRTLARAYEWSLFHFFLYRKGTVVVFAAVVIVGLFLPTHQAQAFFWIPVLTVGGIVLWASTEFAGVQETVLNVAIGIAQLLQWISALLLTGAIRIFDYV